MGEAEDMSLLHLNNYHRGGGGDGEKVVPLSPLSPLAPTHHTKLSRKNQRLPLNTISERKKNCSGTGKTENPRSPSPNCNSNTTMGIFGISPGFETSSEDVAAVFRTELDLGRKWKDSDENENYSNNNNEDGYGGEGGKKGSVQNFQVNEKFLDKMYTLSKVFVFCHSVLSCLGAMVYSVLSIVGTNEWREGRETPGWNIPGGFTPNVLLANMLAVAVNMNLCFSALLVLGFHKKNRRLIWVWYVGQVVIEGVVTVILIFSVTYDCKPTAILSIPPVIYYVISLSFFRQILATLSYTQQQQQQVHIH